ncbi:retrovirus-related pol polyprotein from transposon TNT 1-94 [Tanacetum coccineum]
MENVTSPFVRQTKDLIKSDYNQLFDAEMNKEEVMGEISLDSMQGLNVNNHIEYNVGQFAGNRNGYNAGNQVVQNLVENPGIQNVGNQNGLIVVLGIANQNRNGNVVTARAEGNGNGNNSNQIMCYNCRGVGHYARNFTVKPRRRDAVFL